MTAGDHRQHESDDTKQALPISQKNDDPTAVSHRLSGQGIETNLKIPSIQRECSALNTNRVIACAVMHL